MGLKHKYSKFCILWKGWAWWAGYPVEDRQDCAKLHRAPPALGTALGHKTLFNPRHSPLCAWIQHSWGGWAFQCDFQRGKPDLSSPWLRRHVYFLLLNNAHFIIINHYNPRNGEKLQKWWKIIFSSDFLSLKQQKLPNILGMQNWIKTIDWS